jgi:hypothetical protein
MRLWRRTHPLTPEQRKKMNCRAYTHVLVKRGVIIKQVCMSCGDPDSYIHLPDYSDPRYVVWLCRKDLSGVNAYLIAKRKVDGAR